MLRTEELRLARGRGQAAELTSAVAVLPWLQLRALDECFWPLLHPQIGGVFELRRIWIGMSATSAGRPRIDAHLSGFDDLAADRVSDKAGR
jgi:hypothetical protein